MDNLKEFLKLAERYDNISRREIRRLMRINRKNAKRKLTGFGFESTCTLCISARLCINCIWTIKTNSVCYKKENAKTYFDILNAKNSKQLAKAYKARAAYMREVLERSNHE